MASPAGGVIEAANTITPSMGLLRNAGVPGNGTTEIQTLTIGGTPTGGTFQLSILGFISGAITWSATNATLLANIQAALDAMPVLGASNVVASAGTLTAGIGTVLLTFSGVNLAKLNIGAAFTTTNSLTGTAPTLAVSRSTPGVTAAQRGASTGQLCIDTTNGIAYENTSATAQAPTWVKVSAT